MLAEAQIARSLKERSPPEVVSVCHNSTFKTRGGGLEVAWLSGLESSSCTSDKKPVRAAQPCVIRAAILPLIRSDWPRLCLINRTTHMQTDTHTRRLSLPLQSYTHARTHATMPKRSGSDWQMLHEEDCFTFGSRTAERWQVTCRGEAHSLLHIARQPQASSDILKHIQIVPNYLSIYKI